MPCGPISESDAATPSMSILLLALSNVTLGFSADLNAESPANKSLTPLFILTPMSARNEAVSMPLFTPDMRSDFCAAVRLS